MGVVTTTQQCLHKTLGPQGSLVDKMVKPCYNTHIDTKEQTMMVAYDKKHGGAWDRGSADSYYGRPRNPHMYSGDTATSLRIPYSAMTPDEVVAYHAGYDDNERDGDKKQWY